MSENNNVFRDNEVEANKIASNIMFISFIIYTGIYLLNVVGVFIIKQGIMNLAYILGSVCLLTPYVLVKRFNNHSWYIKYLIVFAAAMFIASTNMVLAFHIVVLFGMPILVASVYFNKKLINTAIICTLILTIISQFLYYNFDLVKDLNFYNMKKFIMFGIFPRSLGIIYFGWLAKRVYARAYTILGNLMSAEEQNNLMKKNELIKNKAQNVSNVLTTSVDDLKNSTKNVSESNQIVSKESRDVLNNTSKK